MAAHLGTGACIGEMGFLGDGLASADIVALPGSRSFSIRVSELQRLIGKHHEIGSSISRQFAVDLARKLFVTTQNA